MVAISLLPLFVSGLTVREVSEPPTGRDVYVSQTESDGLGADSVQFLAGERPMVAPVGTIPGYPERDRDGGQIFTAPATREPFRLESISLRLNGVGAAASGAAVSIQFFEVGGWAAAHDNETRHQKVAAWTDDPRADDYLTGETFSPVRVFSGGRLPNSLHAFQWLRFDLRDAPILRPGKRYAFLLMFDSPVADRSLTLSGAYWGDYAGGHAIRREGSVAEGWNDPAWAAPGKERFSSNRLSQPPSAWGRPNVDTWRDLCFVVQGKPWFGG